MMEEIGLILTIIALGIASWQSHQATKQVSELKEIKNQLSTKYLGNYPSYLSDIHLLLSQAQSSILIVSAMPIQGIFTRYINWERELDMLKEKASQGVKITLVCENDANRKIQTNLQFGKHFTDFDVWKKKGSTSASLKSLIKRFGNNEEEKSITVENFFQLLNKGHESVISELSKIATVYESDIKLDYRCWIIDDKLGIFGYPSFTKDVIAHGFYTNDINMIDAMKENSNKYM